LEGLVMENVVHPIGNFYGHFGTFWVNFGTFFSFLACCTKKNLATKIWKSKKCAIRFSLSQFADKRMNWLLSIHGGQIGWIFAYWAIFSLRLVFEKILLGYFFLFQWLKFCLSFDKNGLDYVLGDFFSSSSGHPVYSL
jgi:hypothetical protein